MDQTLLSVLPGAITTTSTTKRKRVRRPAGVTITKNTTGADYARKTAMDLTSSDIARLASEAANLGDTEQANVYREMLAKAITAEEAGVSLKATLGPILSMEEALELTIEGEESEERKAALAAEGMLAMQVEPLSLRIECIALSRGMLSPLPNEPTRLTTTIGERMPLFSEGRPCMAAEIRRSLYAMDATHPPALKTCPINGTAYQDLNERPRLVREMRSIKARLFWPMTALTRRQAIATGFQPLSVNDRVKLGEQGIIEAYQEQMRNRLKSVCDKFEMIPAGSDTASIGTIHGCQVRQYLLAGKEIVEALVERPTGPLSSKDERAYREMLMHLEAGDATPPSGLEGLHYVQLLFSTLSTEKSTVSIGQERAFELGVEASLRAGLGERSSVTRSVERAALEVGVTQRLPKCYYRNFAVLPQEELSFLSEALGLGEFVSDGGCFYIHPNGEKQARKQQIRAMELGYVGVKTGSDEAQGAPLWAAKGVQLAIPAGEVAMAATKVDISQPKGIQRMAWLLLLAEEADQQGVLILSGPDTIKLQADRARTETSLGTCLVGYTPVRDETNLKGMSNHAYEIAGSTQVTQYVDPARIAFTHDGKGYTAARLIERHIASELNLVAQALRTPEGIAGLISEAAEDERGTLEEIARGEVPEDTGHLARRASGRHDSLTEAIATGVVSLTTDGYAQYLRGEAPALGSVQMPSGVKGRLGDLVSSRVSKILRSQGMAFCGEVNYTTQASAAFKEGFDRKSPLALLSSALSPEAMTKSQSADDDGDLTLFVAGRGFVLMPDGSETLCKLVAIGRYPMAVPFAVMAIPPGTVTPWDDASAKVTRTARLFFGDPFAADGMPYERASLLAPRASETAAAEMRANPESYRVILECDGLISDAGEGVKGDIEKVKRLGELTFDAALDMCDAKATRNSTGSLTRQHEVIALSIAECNLRMVRETSRTEKRRLRRMRDNLVAALKINALALELELTGFKYLTVPGAQVNPATPWGPLGASVPLKVANYDLAPSQRHGIIDNLRVMREGAGISGSQSLERFERECRLGVEGRGNSLQAGGYGTNGPLGAPDWISRMLTRIVASSGIVEAHKAIKATVQPALRFTKIRGAELLETATQEEMEIAQAEARRMLAMTGEWKGLWRQVLAEAELISKNASEQGLSDEETDRLAREITSPAGRAIRALMRSAASGASTLGVLMTAATFLTKAAEEERLLRKDARSVQRAQQESGMEVDDIEAYGVSVAPLLAMLEGRYREAFPLPGAPAPARAISKENSCVCFTQGQNPLPGSSDLVPGQTIEFDAIVPTKGGFAARVGSAAWHLKPATGEKVTAPAGAHLEALALSGSRCLITW